MKNLEKIGYVPVSEFELERKQKSGKIAQSLQRDATVFRALAIDPSILGHDVKAWMQCIPDLKPEGLQSYKIRSGRVVEAVFRG
jgi:hypothetical protein